MGAWAVRTCMGSTCMGSTYVCMHAVHVHSWAVRTCMGSTCMHGQYVRVDGYLNFIRVPEFQ